MSALPLLGDEAVALAALDAGVSAAYAYPGTPSTEILEYVLRHPRPGVHASWSVNEKTAYEQALGVSLAGRRALVAMKHVGLNVAADPFMNSALLDINGGLVIVVADDPGMHSSQNEQDSRVLADFARTICLEPHDPQSAYDMTREAFDLSEEYHVPVMLRLVTRLAHCRAVVTPAAAAAPRPLNKAQDRANWILLPANARRRWKHLLEQQEAFRAIGPDRGFNTLTLESTDIGVITTGVAREYFAEVAGELPESPSVLHVGAYPIAPFQVRQLAEHVRRIFVFEDGYPVIEHAVRGVLPPAVAVYGRETGHLAPDGELTPDTVRDALGLPRTAVAPKADVPARPPQLCAGCPHIDTFRALQTAFGELPRGLVASDIGCYTLAALPPLSAIESCVCMGASIGMAKGASDAGLRPAVAVIGDSTFLHSGITPLLDAIAADTDMTVIIADNEVVAMTGAQTTLVPSSRLQPLLLGLGVAPEHCHVLEAHPKQAARNAAAIARELRHPGLSVIVAVRECVESVRAKKSRPTPEEVLA